jgi:hypothetical protein
MRTPIDLPEELRRQAPAIARDSARTLSETVAALMRRGLGQAGASGEAGLSRSALTGLPVLHLGTMTTTEDVRALDDE